MKVITKKIVLKGEDILKKDILIEKVDGKTIVPIWYKHRIVVNGKNGADYDAYNDAEVSYDIPEDNRLETIPIWNDGPLWPEVKEKSFIQVLDNGVVLQMTHDQIERFRNKDIVYRSWGESGESKGWEGDFTLLAKKIVIKMQYILV